MPNYHAISRERHGGRRWLPASGYAFAAQESTVPLVAGELPKAAMSLPIAFTEQADGYVPAAILSLLPGKNLFVSQNGCWAGEYVPAVIRGFPFRLAMAEDGRQVLCIDEESGLLTDGPAGERFFAEDGKPAKMVLDILNFLNQVEQNRQRTAAACAALQKHALIQPWPIALKTESGQQSVTGLFRIDEAALNRQPADALLELSQSGALLVAYCQLLSMQHLPLLGQLIEAHAKATTALQSLAPGGELDLEFLNDGGTFNFSNL